ncbi:MAG: hypothetical protein R3344_08540, partial [Acidobacteriota bacterium]|nr:hypothetical protein [Acidobacteriota bacterium]
MSGHVASHHFPVRQPRSGVEFSLEHLHTEDRRYLLWALVGALVVHLVVLIVPLPDLKQAFKPPKTTKVVYVRKYIPPPPPVERKQIVQKKIVRKVAIPDPTPDEP